jgi:hypothetical protein
MRIQSVLFGLLAVVGQAVVPAAGLAQHVGFQTAGIAQHRPAQPVHGPVAVAPVRGGIFGASWSAFVVPAPVVAPVPLVPNFPTIIVPNPVLVPGQTIIYPPTIVQPGFPLVPSVPIVQPVLPAYPLPGMPRADVLRLYGQPTVTVITSTGETLYFTGGATVILQNGIVVRPR